VHPVANAADALADFLEVSGLPVGIGSGVDPRVHVDPRGRVTWDVDKQAAANLMEVERVLNELRSTGDDVSMFRGSLSTWFAGVCIFRTADNATVLGPREPVPAEHVRRLRVLGVFIDANGSMTLEAARLAVDGVPADR
jgi:hypothetical protein